MAAAIILKLEESLQTTRKSKPAGPLWGTSRHGAAPFPGANMAMNPPTLGYGGRNSVMSRITWPARYGHLPTCGDLSPRRLASAFCTFFSLHALQPPHLP